MISIRRVDVPEYLRTGDWFEALDPDDEGAFEVPADCFKANENVHTKEDLFYLLKSLQYWQVQDTPMSAMVYVYRSDSFDVSAEFPVFSSWLQNLRTVKEAIPHDRISVALKTNFRMEMIRWLHENSDCELCAEACVAAACADDVESLAYLHEFGCPWDANTIKEAIMRGSIACLEYAHAHGCPALPTGENPVNLAALRGHIHMIKYLRNTLINSQGAEGLACTQYLHEAGCPWKEDFCMYAALRGRLDCLQYAHEHGCPWNESVLITAVSFNHLDCLQYAHEHDCPWCAHVTYVTAREGYLDCMKYAHEHGCLWHDRTTSAAFYMDNWWCLYYAVVHGASYAAVVWFIVLVIGCVLFFSMFAHYAYELYCGDSTKRRLVLYCTVLLFQLIGLAPWVMMMTVGSESSVRVTVEQLVYWLFFCELISSTNLAYVLYLRHFHHVWLWGEE